MQQSIKIIRPATAAIAVVLAGTAAAPLWAQDAAVAPPPVITTTAPAVPVAAPPDADFAPPPIARTVAPEANASRTTVDAGALAQAEAERPAPRRAAPTPTRAAPIERAAAAPVTPRTASPAAAEPVAAAPVAAAPVAAAPVAPQVVNDPAAMAAATAPSAPAATEASNPNGGIPIAWLLGGLGALALLGLAAAMLIRRRQESDYNEVHAHPELATVSAQPTVARPVPAAASSPALAEGPVRAADGHLIGRHEALAMQGPSEENPFLTLRKRLKRAHFYDRQERLAGVAQQPALAPEPQPAFAAAAAPVREAVRPTAREAVRDTGVVRSNIRPARRSAFGWPGAPKPAMG